MKALILHRREEKRIKNGHLWIYSNEVNTQLSPLKDFSPGEQVLVRSSNGTLLGTAYVNPHSLICARIFNRNEGRLDYNLLVKRIKNALLLRENLYDQPFYRLVYGESDLLPGLVVDRFGRFLCVQINTAGMESLKNLILDALCKVIRPEAILLRNDSPMRTLEGLNRNIEDIHGTVPDEVEIVENGAAFIVPLKSGQKTGWFYDQRSNRKMLEPFVQGKRVLDVFSYIGGFAIEAGVFGASQIWAVDGSRMALEMAERNAELNGLGSQFTGCQGDAFHVLKALEEEEEFFDVIVIDPPAFVKRKKDHREGLRAYHRINELAVRLLAPEGFLLSASCSMHLKQLELMDVVRNSSIRNGRHAQVIIQGSQGADHPVHPAIPETHYLKALLSRVV